MPHRGLCARARWAQWARWTWIFTRRRATPRGRWRRRRSLRRRPFPKGTGWSGGAVALGDEPARVALPSAAWWPTRPGARTARTAVRCPVRPVMRPCLHHRPVVQPDSLGSQGVRSWAHESRPARLTSRAELSWSGRAAGARTEPGTGRTATPTRSPPSGPAPPGSRRPHRPARSGTGSPTRTRSVLRPPRGRQRAGPRPGRTRQGQRCRRRRPVRRRPPLWCRGPRRGSPTRPTSTRRSGTRMRRPRPAGRCVGRGR